MKRFLWKPEKNEELKRRKNEGRVSFEEIENAILNGGLRTVYTEVNDGKETQAR